MENKLNIWIIILTSLLIIVMMIPITDLVITPSKEPQPLDTPIFELNNYTLNQIFNDNAITWNDFKDSEQLVTNGDFSDEATGWGSNSNIVVTDGIGRFIGLGDSDIIVNSPTISETIKNAKYYLKTDVKYDGNINALWLRTVGIVDNEILVINNITLNIWHSLSVVGTLRTSTTGIQVLGFYPNSNAQLNNSIYVDNMMLFNITNLITKKQYSPLFNTTFDLMSNAQIKEQMDDFITTGEASPNQINIWMTYTVLGLTNLTKDQMLRYYDLFLYYNSL